MMKAIRPVVLLVLLVALTLLAVKRKNLTAEEAVDDTVRTVVKLEDSVVRDEFAAVAFLAVVALYAFVMWTALRAKESEEKVVPPAKESTANETTAFR